MLSRPSFTEVVLSGAVPTVPEGYRRGSRRGNLVERHAGRLLAGNQLFHDGAAITLLAIPLRLFMPFLSIKWYGYFVTTAEMRFLAVSAEKKRMRCESYRQCTSEDSWNS